MKRAEEKQNDAPQRLPAPTAPFRQRAWRQFQRALDPLAPPRPLPVRRRER